MSNERPSIVEFEAQLKLREAEIQSIMPRHVPLKRFMNTAVMAIKHNPELLHIDRRSLHRAITQAAEDGLMPDGREGVINTYSTKVKRRNEHGRDEEVWIKMATWIPMVHGIRKRAMELGGIILNTEVVHENDTFVWAKGDEPKIEHVPPRLGKPRGEMVGAYCIIRKGPDILHREVMSKFQIDVIREKSKSPNGLLWKDFTDEAWRKTVLRRAVKTVPAIPDDLRTIVERDDAHYDLDLKAEPAVSEILLAPPPPGPPPAPGATQPVASRAPGAEAGGTQPGEVA